MLEENGRSPRHLLTSYHVAFYATHDANNTWRAAHETFVLVDGFHRSVQTSVRNSGQASYGSDAVIPRARLGRERGCHCHISMQSRMHCLASNSVVWTSTAATYRTRISLMLNKYNNLQISMTAIHNHSTLREKVSAILESLSVTCNVVARIRWMTSSDRADIELSASREDASSASSEGGCLDRILYPCYCKPLSTLAHASLRRRWRRGGGGFGH